MNDHTSFIVRHVKNQCATCSQDNRRQLDNQWIVVLIEVGLFNPHPQITFTCNRQTGICLVEQRDIARKSGVFRDIKRNDIDSNSTRFLLYRSQCIGLRNFGICVIKTKYFTLFDHEFVNVACWLLCRRIARTTTSSSSCQTQTTSDHQCTGTKTCR